MTETLTPKPTPHEHYGIYDELIQSCLNQDDHALQAAAEQCTLEMLVAARQLLTKINPDHPFIEKLTALITLRRAQKAKAHLLDKESKEKMEKTISSSQTLNLKLDVQRAASTSSANPPPPTPGTK